MISCRKVGYIESLYLLAKEPQYIYVLTYHGDPFYVGRTNNPDRRLDEHRLHYHIPIAMTVIENVQPHALVYEREIRWIQHYRQNGDITNKWPNVTFDDIDYLQCSLDELVIDDEFFYSKNFPNEQHLSVGEVVRGVREMLTSAARDEVAA